METLAPRTTTKSSTAGRATHSVQVKPVARHFGNCGVAEYVIADVYDTRDLEYLKRCGMKPENVQRPPRSGDWHGFLPEEIPEGQHRVIVNLLVIVLVIHLSATHFAEDTGTGKRPGCLVFMGKHRDGMSPANRKLISYGLRLRPETLTAWKEAAARMGMSQRQAAEYTFRKVAREQGIDIPAHPGPNGKAAITEPLPESLDDLAALLDLRSIVYAVIHTLQWSLDDSLELIGRLAEIDRRIALI
jgi:hypothetical protein